MARLRPLRGNRAENNEAFLRCHDLFSCSPEGVAPSIHLLLKQAALLLAYGSSAVGRCGPAVPHRLDKLAEIHNPGAAPCRTEVIDQVPLAPGSNRRRRLAFEDIVHELGRSATAHRALNHTSSEERPSVPAFGEALTPGQILRP